MANCKNLTVKWPWTMIPLASADEWIEFIKEQIGPGHPLYEKEIFPSMRREDGTDILLIENDTDGTYALLYPHEKAKYRGSQMPKTKIIATREEIKKLIEFDHKKAVGKV